MLYCYLERVLTHGLLLLHVVKKNSPSKFLDPPLNAESIFTPNCMTFVCNGKKSSLFIISLFMQLLEAVIMALFGLIQNLAMFAETKCYFEHTEFVTILTVYLKQTKPDISFMAILTLAMLIDVMDTDEKKVLIFDEETILGYIKILQQAVLEPDLAAKDVHGSLVIPADDILRLLKHLWHIEINREKIIKLYPSLMPLLETCLTNGKEIHLIATLDLLWTITSESDLLVATAERDTTTAVLVGLLFDVTVSTQVRSMAHCVFYKLNPEQVEGMCFKECVIVCIKNF